MSSEQKRELFSHFAALGKTLGNEHRLELLEHLGQAEQSVEGLAERIGLSVANASQHLQVLRRHGLVVARRSGKQVFYRMAEGPIVEALAALRSLAEQNMLEAQSVIAGYFTQLDTMEPVGSEELLKRMQREGVTLLDVRPADEFRNGHLPGAINISLGDLETKLSDLPRDREIIAYCRGPYCVLSYQAVAILRSHGLTVRRFRDGLPEWRAAGLPVSGG